MMISKLIIGVYTIYNVSGERGRELVLRFTLSFSFLSFLIATFSTPKLGKLRVSFKHLRLILYLGLHYKKHYTQNFTSKDNKT